MAGNADGAARARATILKKYGEDFFKKIGRKGGKVKHPETRAFHANKALASVAGRKGGLKRKGE